MNIIIIAGRLTRDPEVRYPSGEGSVVASFSIAVDRRFKRDGQPDADFFNCTAFGKLAEFSEKYLHKGIKMIIQGRLQNNNYKNRDGQTVYSNQIVVENMEFAESKAASANTSGADPRQQSQNNSQEQQTRADEFMNIPDGIDEELPFN